MYIAHSDAQRTQTVAQHSINTAELCAEFALNQWREAAYACGILHDIGKYQPGFQSYIRTGRPRTPHALCGGLEIRKIYRTSPVSMMLQYVVAGHHGGLADYGTKGDPDYLPTLRGTLARNSENYEAYKEDITPPDIDLNALNQNLAHGCRTVAEAAERFAFLTRYLYSCLTDADWLDTEQFMLGRSRTTLRSDFAQCLQKLEKKLGGFACTTDLQRKRAGLQAQVFEHINDNGNIFLMNMPTGSGKTLASIKFALERAIAKGKKRIIYIIPYNSIIDQTADVFSDIFGDSAAILRHQSSFLPEDSGDLTECEAFAMKQSTENWDANIILTTAVQFFESVYGNKRSKLRKMHNMAESILVFDEAHLMPTPYLQPCLAAVSHITTLLNSDAVFLSATMPNFKELFLQMAAPATALVDTVPNKDDFAGFSRCTYKNIGEVSEEELLQSASAYPSTLIVVNTRKKAAELYRMASGEKYHLSTYMTAADRARVIARVKARIAELEQDYPVLEKVPEERRITVVSTSLIEAGVDLDFYCVYRQLWGLDSILQSGGRCNREGKRRQASVFIFDWANQRRAVPPAVSITAELLRTFGDISSPECIERYYQQLFFARHDELLQNSLGNKCSNPVQIPFATYARQFEIIDSGAVSIFVPQDEKSEALAKELRDVGYTNMRQAQKYCCSVYERELAQLIEQGVVEVIGGVNLLNIKSCYSSETGIRFEGQDYYF